MAAKRKLVGPLFDLLQNLTSMRAVLPASSAARFSLNRRHLCRLFLR